MSNVACVFAGQGAQFVGMGRDLSDMFPECRDLFMRADEVLGRPISEICFDGPAEALTRSDNCQPAIFVMSVACYTALKQKMPAFEFSATAGLSLGEWTALHVAGALSFEDTLRVLDARGRFMQEACDERDGGMISIIGLDAPSLDKICAESGCTVSNINSSAQVVLSGEKSAVAKAEELAKAAGAKRAVVLNVAGAFHSPLMASAREKLAAVLEDVTFSQPVVPVLSNVSGKPHEMDTMADMMLRQVTETVRWVDDVMWCAESGITGLVEFGPGKVLSGLVRRISRDLNMCNVQDTATLESAVAAL